PTPPPAARSPRPRARTPPASSTASRGERGRDQLPVTLMLPCTIAIPHWKAILPGLSALTGISTGVFKGRSLVIFSSGKTTCDRQSLLVVRVKRRTRLSPALASTLAGT